MAARTLEKPSAGTPRPPIPRGGGGRGRPPAGAETTPVGVWLLLAAITMLFVGFTATYLTRRASGDWTAPQPPRVLWATTTILLASSGTMEWARRALRGGDVAAARRGLAITLALGVAFLAGQVLAWTQLRAAGAFMATSPAAAFFYLLTGAHGVHVLGGLVALALAVASARRGRPARADGVAAYWHFLDALWLYLFVILFVA